MTGQMAFMVCFMAVDFFPQLLFLSFKMMWPSTFFKLLWPMFKNGTCVFFSQLAICIIVLFTIPVFVRQEEGVEVLPHKEQLASVSNSTCRAEPGMFPGHVPGAVLLLCCSEQRCPGCSASHCRVWSRGVGTLAFQRGQGLQFPSDQGLWAKFHPEHLCGTAVPINNNTETYGERQTGAWGMLTAKSQIWGSNLRECYQKVFVILKCVSLVLLHLIDGFTLPEMYSERLWQFSRQENFK